MVWSVGKSLAALTLARAVRRSAVPSFDAAVPLSNDPTAAAAALPVPAWFDGGAAGGPLRTWRQFLMMTADFGLRDPDPGARCAYSHDNNAVEWYATALAQALNASSAAAVDGADLPAAAQVSGYRGGFAASPRDLARLGKARVWGSPAFGLGVLLLARGRWGGEQFLPLGWAEAAM
eukprot:gene54952-40201_t